MTHDFGAWQDLGNDKGRCKPLSAGKNLFMSVVQVEASTTDTETRT